MIAPDAFFKVIFFLAFGPCSASWAWSAGHLGILPGLGRGSPLVFCPVRSSAGAGSHCRTARRPSGLRQLAVGRPLYRCPGHGLVFFLPFPCAMWRISQGRLRPLILIFLLFFYEAETETTVFSTLCPCHCRAIFCADRWWYYRDQCCNLFADQLC